MILRRVIEHLRKQHWTAVLLDFLIVVLGVYVGLQVNTWNEARLESVRRAEIVDALVTNLNDAVTVQTGFVADIETGLSQWREAYDRGERPAPFYYRIEGSDTAPNVWSTFEQMQLTDLFDPVTLFDLAFFYSELNGVGRKYVRYVTFVEDRVLPQLLDGADGFYDARGRLRPEFRANMDRLREYQQETIRLTEWANCLIYRLRAQERFAQTCRRAGFRLPGMEAEPANP